MGLAETYPPIGPPLLGLQKDLVSLRGSYICCLETLPLTSRASRVGTIVVIALRYGRQCKSAVKSPSDLWLEYAHTGTITGVPVSLNSALYLQKRCPEVGVPRIRYGGM